MKAVKGIVSALAAGLLAMGLSLGGVFCIATAYSLQVDERSLVWGCLWLACMGTAVYLRPRVRWLCFLVLWLAGLAWVKQFYRPNLWYSFRYVVQTIAEKCATGYAWFPVPDWRPTHWMFPDDAGPVLVLWAAVLVQAAVVSVRRRRGLPAVVVGGLSLGVCLILVDTLPALWALFLLLGSLCLLLLTRRAARQGTFAAGGLTLALAVPVAALLLGLAVLFPRESYERTDWVQKIQLHLTAFADRMLWGEGVAVTSEEQRDVVALSAQGERRQNHTPVMDVTATASGLLYLRGQAYTTYTGTRWETPEEEALPQGNAAMATGAALAGQFPSCSVEIHTRRVHEVMYTPYYTSAVLSSQLRGDICVLSGGRTDYSLRYVPENFLTRLNKTGYTTVDTAYVRYVKENYLQLPENTRQALCALLDEAGVGSDPQAIGEYVQNSAAYSLRTGAMPVGEEDFVLWFLQESDTGYCVHFASTAVAMLRARGIPARYVTGYVANCRAGETVLVTSDTAHAWAEYSVEGFGWVPLEATPGDFLTIEEEDDPTATPTATPTPTPSAAPVSSREEETPRETATPTPAEETTRPGGRELNLYWLWLPGGMLGVWFVFFLYRRLGLWRLRRRFGTGPVNRRALHLWENIDRLSAWVGETPPREMEELALKARFSQHRLEQQELAALARHRTEVAGRVRRLPWYKRFVVRWVLVLC